MKSSSGRDMAGVPVIRMALVACCTRGTAACIVRVSKSNQHRPLTVGDISALTRRRRGTQVESSRKMYDVDCNLESGIHLLLDQP